MLAKLLSSPLKAGATAPDFTLPDQHGAEVNLQELLKQGPVVLFFYPKAFTGVCTAEACSFRDNHEIFADAGAQVVGISTDSVKTQASFAKRFRLSYPVLSDRGGKVHSKFGVRNGPSFVFNDRVTFVIDRDATVRSAFSGLLLASAHVEESLEIVRGLVAAGAGADLAAS